MVTEVLQFNQLSLEEYCMILLARVVPMFRGSLCAETGITESAVNSLHGILSLTKRVFPPDLWRSGTQLNSLMVCKKNCLKLSTFFSSSNAAKGSITSHFVCLCSLFALHCLEAYDWAPSNGWKSSQVLTRRVFLEVCQTAVGYVIVTFISSTSWGAFLVTYKILGT